MPACIETICVGQIRDYGSVGAALDPSWTTAFFKTPVAGPVAIARDGIVGDAQADLRHHGGPDKAILACSADHFVPWRLDLGEPHIQAGGFGENFSCSGVAEQSVCVGDRWRVGDVLLEVSQPRQPCWKLGRRWGRPELVKRVVETGRTGWYLRVLESGLLTAPAAIEVVARPHPDWTIARANDIFYRQRNDASAVRELIALPQLSDAWRDDLARTLQGS